MKVAVRGGRDETEAETVAGEAGVGQSFGPYRTIRVLGEGGMGVVYLASQEHPIRRTVALKVIKPGMGAPTVFARFETERDALALMDHPNIARVFDAGTTDDGRPYFAMEYVPGVPIVEYCDRNRLTNRERLELFRQVCLGIHHAHQKGIIHRDIKPSNVLVEIQDGRPVPKVIDFGVAKAIRPEIVRSTLFTEAGVLIGTPEYMSPEQAQMSPDGVDTATDIYSLGVLLYELLVGTLPFEARELRRAGYLEILRKIREDDPPRPAARLKTMGGTAADMATRRRTTLHSLERELRGDLEWITMRAIEKDRGRRYPSASELAADIQRHLNDEPVLASPPSRLYRIRKFVRKNRVPVVAAIAVLLCLVAGLSASTVLYLREQEQRGAAEFHAYTSSLANADALMAAGKYDEARTHLFQCAPSLRGWEWRMLYAQSDNSLAALHGTGDATSGPQMIGFTPDARRLYLTMWRTVHLWDTSSWESVGNYGPFDEILAIAPDASVVLTRSWTSRELVLVEVFSGKRLATLAGKGSRAAFSSDGKRIAVKSADGVRMWAAGIDKPPTWVASECTGPTYNRPQFSPDSALLACATESSVVLFETASGRVVRRFQLSMKTPVATAFTPDGRHFALCDWLASCRIWNLDPDSEAGPVIADTRVWSLAFSPDGAYLASGSWDKPVVRIWDTRTGKPLGALSASWDEENCCRAVAYSSDGKLIASASRDGVRVWDARTLAGSILDRWIPNRYSDLAVDRHARLVLTRGDQGVRLLNASSGEVFADCAVGGRAVAIATDHDGNRFVAGTEAGSVGVFDRTCHKLMDLGQEGEGVTAVAFNENGTLIAAAWGGTRGPMDVPEGKHGTIAVWDATTGKRTTTIKVQHPVQVLAFRPGPEGAQLASGEFYLKPLEPTVKVWDAPSGRLVRAMKGPLSVEDGVRGLAFTPDGRRLVGVGNGMEQFAGRIRIWDADSGRLLHSVDDHSWGVTAVAIHPDGRLIATASYDRTIRLWDGQRYRPLFTIRRPEAVPQRLVFSHDGNQLFCAYGDGTVRAWVTRTLFPAEVQESVAQLARDRPLIADVRLRLATDRRLDDATRAMALRIAELKPEAQWAVREYIAQPLLSPNSGRAAYELAYQRAEKLYHRAPMSYDNRFWLAVAHYRLGRYQAAIASLEDVYSSDPDDFASPAVLAMAYWRTGQLDRANANLEKARASFKVAVSLGNVDEEVSLRYFREAEALVASRPPKVLP